MQLEPNAAAWCEQLQPYSKYVEQSNKLLILEAVPVLLELYIPQLWIIGKLTKESQDNLWVMLNYLLDSARVLHPEFVKPVLEPPASAPFDWQQAMNGEGMSGLDQILGALPEDIRTRLEAMAAKQQARMESKGAGPMTLQDIMEMHKELMGEMKQSDITTLMSIASQFFKGMNLGDGLGGGGLGSIGSLLMRLMQRGGGVSQ